VDAQLFIRWEAYLEIALNCIKALQDMPGRKIIMLVASDVTLGVHDLTMKLL
jgi:hypothetical protein